MSCDRAMVRVNARLGLIDKEDQAEESGGLSSRGVRGGSCREEEGDVLDDATAEDGEVQGAPVEAGRHIGRVYLGEELHDAHITGERGDVQQR